MAKNLYVGVDTEVPRYNVELEVDITADNIADYFTVTNGTYYFVGSGSTFTTNSKGVNNSTATTTLVAKSKVSNLSFDYSCSSEKNYDTFSLTVAGAIIEDRISGVKTGTYEGSIQAGDSIVFTYTKDSSAADNDDQCSFFNVKVLDQTLEGYDLRQRSRRAAMGYIGIDNVARRIKKLYVGDENHKARLSKIFWTPYLTFSSDNEFTVGTYQNQKLWDNKMEYSVDKINWTVWTGSAPISSSSNDGKYNLYLRGEGNTEAFKNTNYSSGSGIVFTGTDISCDGSIETLLDYQTILKGKHPSMGEYAFAGMFSNCLELVKAPELTSEDLNTSCYFGMFYNCTKLTKAPELPATSLVYNCYSGMFFGCTSLTQAPKLPAMTLAVGCYYRMFYNCTGLTQAPELPAIQLNEACYGEMFANCINLTLLPELPATSLVSRCYENMFSGCKGLTIVPENYLPATNLAEYCYWGMFINCANLTSAPNLPATTLASYCYAWMFGGCPSLVQAPALPATNLAVYCYSSMFSSVNSNGEEIAPGCISLTSVPDLPAITLSPYCYSWMFDGCTGLTALPEDYLPATTLAEHCYHSMFRKCSGLTSMVNLPATTLAPYCYAWMYCYCTGLTSFKQLNVMTMEEGCYQGMFSACSFSSFPIELPATTLAFKCYDQMFLNCSSLVVAPALPATIMARCCYSQMFKKCTALETPPLLPATELDAGCYASMFSDCTSLKEAPELPALKMKHSCYYTMFYGCTSLLKAPDLPATTLDVECYRGMFNRSGLVTPPKVLPAKKMASKCYAFMFEMTKIATVPIIKASVYANSCFYGMFDDISTLSVYTTEKPGYGYAWTAPNNSYTDGMFGTDDNMTSWAKLDGENFPNNGTPEEGTTYYFPFDIEKGDIIKLNLDGEKKNYRILSKDENKVKIMSMWDLGSSTFGSNPTYSNGTSCTIRSFLINWFNSLTSEAQKATVIKDSLSTYSYTFSNTYYNSATHASYADYSTKNKISQIANETIYPVDVEDIEMYFGGSGGSMSDKNRGTFSKEDLYKLFWNESYYSNHSNIWLRSAYGSNAYMMVANGGYIGVSSPSNSLSVRASMVIDLTKIAASPFIPKAEKGELLVMNLDGTEKTYRAVNPRGDGETVEVVGLFNAASGIAWGQNNTYSGSACDTALNTTWYNKLSTEAKAAIVAKDIRAYDYPALSSFSSTSHASIADYANKGSGQNVGSRNVYLLDIEDIEQYYGGTGGATSYNTPGIYGTNDLREFFDLTPAFNIYGLTPCFRSVVNNSTNKFWYFDNTTCIKNVSVLNGYSFNPAFQINLSKVDFKNDIAEKGEILTINVDGEDKNYRVLDSKGTVVEVLSMWHTTETYPINETNTKKYAGSTTDTYLNTTWYNNLPTEQKKALVPKTIAEDWWDYNGSSLSGYPVYKRTSDHLSENFSYRGIYADIGDRYVYIPSLEEIIKYIQDVYYTSETDRFSRFPILLSTYFNELTWNNYNQPAYGDRFFLRTISSADYPDLNNYYSFRVVEPNDDMFSSLDSVNKCAICPTFQIDLSKVSYSRSLAKTGDLITMNLDGTKRKYRVLTCTGKKAKVLGMWDDFKVSFGTDGIYGTSTLNNYLNNTWYNTFTSTAKSALIQENIINNKWTYNTGSSSYYTYQGIRGTTIPGGETYKITSVYGTAGNYDRLIYAPQIKDIYAYIFEATPMNDKDTIFSNKNLWKMFWDDEESHPDSNIWLRDTTSDQKSGWGIKGEDGGLMTYSPSENYIARPMFTIDLSKVDFEFVPLLDKGTLITMNLDGTDRQYRVLKNVGEGVHEILGMWDLSTSQRFYASSNVYNGSDLDTYLNTTWYNTLSTEAKNAIVPKNITQYQYTYNSSIYNTTTHASYADYSTKAVKEVIGDRYVYALDVEDIENYFNNTFGNADIWTLFWKTTSRLSGDSYPWLRSARADNFYSAWFVSGGSGCVNYDIVTSARAVRGALQIDLSKVSYTIST